MICICVSSLSLTYPYPHQILINVRSIIIGPKEVFFSYWVSEMIWWKSSENRTLKSVKTLLWLTEWKWSAPLCSSFPCTTGAQIYIETENDLTYNIQIFRKIKTQIFLLISHWDSSIVVVYLRPLMSDSQLGLPFFQLVDFKTAGLATGDTIKEGFDKDDDDRINADLSATLMEVWAGGEYACPMYFVRSSRTCFLRRPPPSPLLFCYPTICPVNLQLWLPRSRAGLVLTLC